MAQGIFGGMTNYDDQSTADIVKDIKRWIEFTRETKKYIEDGISTLKTIHYLDKVPFNFQTTLISSIRCQTTFLSDFNIILHAINNNKITTREVELMRKIGSNAKQYNHEFGKSYKEESRWKEYGNEDFKLAEKLYQNGRDYFVTMQDVSNASVRLRDYINTIPNVMNQTVNQTVNGKVNVVSGINSGIMNNNINLNLNFRSSN